MFSLLTIAAFTANVALGYDFRFEITKPDGLSMQLFETAFFAVCDGFPWARDPNNSYAGPHALFVPGDYQGKNNDTTALAYCVYYSPDGHPIQFTAGVAQLLGGNTTTPCNATSNEACAFQYEADGAFIEGGSTSYPTFGYQYTDYGASATASMSVSGAPVTVTSWSSAATATATSN